MNGKIYLVATPIGNLEDITLRALRVLKEVDLIAAEDTRNTLKLLSHFDIHTKMISYHNFNEQFSTKGIIKLLSEGNNVALVSDAGYPLISDPGYELVNEVIDNGFNITTISGANAAINALVASGLNTSHYLFYGFLNSKLSQARKQLEDLKQFPYTLIFYEAPHRIEKTIKLMYEVFGDRKAVIARELTKLHEQYYRDNLSKLCELKDLKGEIVILVQGYQQEVKKLDEDELIKEIEKLIKQGYKTKEAVNEIAKKYDISKNSLYNTYLKKR